MLQQRMSRLTAHNYETEKVGVAVRNEAAKLTFFPWLFEDCGDATYLNSE